MAQVIMEMARVMIRIIIATMTMITVIITAVVLSRGVHWVGPLIRVSPLGLLCSDSCPWSLKMMN